MRKNEDRVGNDGVETDYKIPVNVVTNGAEAVGWMGPL